jgi:hypothetical protein
MTNGWCRKASYCVSSPNSDNVGNGHRDLETPG